MTSSAAVENSKTNNTQWIKGINSIRFILAFIVLLGHIDHNPLILTLKDSSNIFAKYAGLMLSVAFNGPAAVVAFFVISGFVIHYPNRQGITSLRKFYTRRYTRVILPMIAAVIIGLFCGSPEIGIFWSLFCELIYYTLYPALLKWKVTWNAKLALSCCIYLILVALLCSNDYLSFFHQKNEGYDGNYVELGTGLVWLIGFPCWLVGVKLADEIQFLQETPLLIKLWFSRLGILSLMSIALILRFHAYVSYIFSLNLLVIPIYFWLRTEILYYRTHKPIRFLEKWGEFSFSLYLIHPILLTVLPIVIPINNYTVIPFIALVVFLAWVFYKIVEERSHLLAIKLSRK